MARTHFDGFEVTSAGDTNQQATVIELNGEGALQLPTDLDFASTDILRDGQDLILRDADGTEVTVNNYFNADPAPSLLSATGHQSLSPQLVQAFVQHDGDIRVASTHSLSDASPVGEVMEIAGDAKIIRTDGTEGKITLGMSVFEGDIIETEGDGAVNIGFIDESSFAVSENARIAIDEFVFDPATEAGTQDFSVLRGVFMYTSGLIGRENPDSVDIETPVGSIGIRGTIIGGRINPVGESQITVIEGAIVVRNGGGELLLSIQFDTVKLAGFDAPMSHIGAMRVQDVANDYGAVKDVSATLFSSFHDQMQEQGPSNGLDEKSSEGEQPSEAQSDQVLDEIQAEENPLNTELKSQQDSKTKPDAQNRDTHNDSHSTDHSGNYGEAEHFIKKTDEITTLTLEFKSGGDVDEHAVAGTVVGKIGPAASMPFGVKYSLVDDLGGLFVIDANTGVVTLNQDAPDFETASSHSFDLQVQATRADTGTSRVFDLSVNLQDINDPADISYGTVSILNESDTGLIEDVVLQDIHVNDPDTSAVFTSMAFSVNDNRFTVRMVNGEYKLVALKNAVFDYEQDTDISLIIQPSDGTNAYAAQSVTVQIGNLIDEAPTAIDITNTVIDENEIGAVVGTLSTTDADIGDTHSYRIIGDGNDLFEIIGNILRLKSGMSADFETQELHEITIEVTDAGGLTYQKVITVNVADMNDQANFVNGTSYDISETTNGSSLSADRVVQEINLIDQDSNAAFREHMFTVDDNRFTVEWNNASGQYELIAKAGSIFDYETEQSITVSITADDGIHSYAPHIIEVNITNVNEAPTDITLTNTVIDENVNGALVGTLDTIDPDAPLTEQVFTYQIEDNPGGIFEIINGNELRIKDGYAADFEAQSSYRVRVRVTDQDNLSIFKDFDITVNDINEVPVLELDLADRFDLISNVQGFLPIGVRGAIIGKINISDPENAEFNASDFSLDSGRGQYFTVIEQNGEFFLKLQDSYTLRMDGSTPKIFDNNANSFLSAGNLNLGQKWDLTIYLDDGGATPGSLSISVTTGPANLTRILDNSGENYTVLPSHEGAIVFGGDGNDTITISHENFKFISGGKGYDKLVLDGILGNTDDFFNFASNMSNTSGNSADLRSIEEIVVSSDSNDIENTLRMNMEDILNLLRTSDNGELRITAANINEMSKKAKVEFMHEGTKTALTNYDADGVDGADFVQNGTVNHDGHNYYVFTHDLGQVLLDANLMNGASGGAPTT